MLFVKRSPEALGSANGRAVGIRALGPPAAGARQRCWRHPWVLDLDISLLRQIDSNLLMRAVRKHTDCPRGAFVHREVAEGAPPPCRRVWAY